MSKKERDWFRVLERVKKKEITLRQAAQIMGGSYRQCLRKYKRYRQEGEKGLVHRGRGQASNRAKDREARKGIIDRYQERYEDFGPTLAAEKLAKEGYEVNHETLRRWLRKAVEEAAKAITAPVVAAATIPFRRTSSNGRVASQVVRRAGRDLLPDEYGG